MKTTLTTNDIVNALRADEYAGWSHWEALALAEYFEEYEEETGEELELDTVAIRCEFSAYADLHNWAELCMTEEELEVLIKDAETKEEEEEAIRDYIIMRGTLIERQIEDGMKGIMRSVCLVSEF